jgi:two-component system OmpR family response regulator
MKTILLVDDDRIFRTLMVGYLDKLGFNVIELESGKAVIQLIQDYEIEAILLDLVMADQEGLETIVQLARLNRCPKVIAVSSHPDYLELATFLGADDSLIKPVRIEMLKMALEKLEIIA